MIALSLLLLVAAAQAVLIPTPVNDNDDVINSAGAPVTACESGAINNAAGTLCTPVTQCTAQWYLENVANLETEAPISLEPGKVVGTNSLNIVVQHAAVKGRKVTGIVLKDGATREFSLFFTSIFSLKRSLCYVKKEKQKKRKKEKKIFP
jgi:hypothetical protein